MLPPATAVSPPAGAEAAKLQSNNTKQNEQIIFDVVRSLIKFQLKQNSGEICFYTSHLGKSRSVTLSSSQ